MNRITTRFFLLVLLAISCNSFLAQTASGYRLSGAVAESVAQAPIEGVKVTLEVPEHPYLVITDKNGAFAFEGVPAGRFVIRFEKAGYNAYVIPDLAVNSGKNNDLLISLETIAYDAKPVTITANTTSRDIQAVSTRTFTVEESRRYAATYYDPARLVTSYPGVIQNNDQANSVVVRGNSPNGVVWRLEGVDILSPNHLGNAGTFSDRITPSGGGFTILSAQMMGNSQFLSGAFPAQYGNALAGVFDIHLRNGQNSKQGYTASAGLIGVDFATEGPLGHNGGSYLANYRYSFTGLLALMGIKFGGEDIRFQDFSFNLNLPTKKAGTFTLFGLGGLSSNVFAGPRADSLVTEAKDRYDIRFNSKMGATGITHKLLLNERTLWRSTLAISGQASERVGDLILNQNQTRRVESDLLNQSRLSFTSSLVHKVSDKVSVTGGLYLYRYGYELQSLAFDTTGANNQQILASGKGNTWLVQPYVQTQIALSPKVNFQVGLHGMYLTLNGSGAIEPRTSISYKANSRNQLRLAYGLHSMMQLPGTYFATPGQEQFPIVQPNKDLGFTRAHHLVFSYSYRPGEHTEIRVEPYYQALFNVPIAKDPTQIFSAINLLEGYVSDSLMNSGKGQNYGVEVSVEQVLTKGFYFLVGGSWYRSLYTAADGVERSTRFDGKYQGSATAGWEKGFGDKNKIIGVNVRMIYQGGFLGQPIDYQASIAQGRTVFVANSAYTDQFANFFRTDLRILLKRNRAKLTRSFAIDIQNVTNHQNEAFRVYDPVAGQVLTRYQLGIVPLMTYLLEF